ncbi:SAM-dependent methyltransferase [Micromonospora sp. NPDC049900]|uniref:SAM-dependent methyltransferase n=1 Tax=Micromonospora sp. NPDC049900 TaxID=3364275 RepID=UPI0037A76069
MSMPWRAAMHQALYGPSGFFVSGSGPAAHFRTSVHASPVFASALLRLIHHLDAALGFPERFDVVDVGAGRGELLSSLAAAVGVSGEPSVAVKVSGEPTRSGRSGLIPARVGSPETLTSTAAGRAGGFTPEVGGTGVPLVERVRFTAVELASRPDELPEQIAWTDEIPDGVIGLLLATEWLDNVPLDLAVHGEDGWRYLLVDPTSGEETTGDPVSRADAAWLTTWWPPQNQPHPTDGTLTDGTPSERNAEVARAEIGRTRDEAWAAAVGHVERGLAVAVDYGHLRAERPLTGSLTGYRNGRQVPPVPDGSCDVTAHVAMDSVASAGERVARCAYSLRTQREGLRALGADGGRPPLRLAYQDPAGYVRALAEATAAAELTDPAGLGGHLWLWQPVGLAVDRLPLRA